MSSQEAAHVSSKEVTPNWGKGLWILAVSSAARWSDSEPAISRRMWWNEAVGKPPTSGCMRASA